MNSHKQSSGRSAADGDHPGPRHHPHPATDRSAPPAAGPEAAATATAPAGLQQELAAQKDDYLRLAADFDNYKKRTRRDAERQGAAEKESFIGDLLPVLDNLERALASDQASSSAPLHQGVTLTLQQVGQLLHRHGIEPVADVGRPFDPHRHEAVAVRQDPRQPDQTILEVTQRGYDRGDRVFRPAKVIVNDLRPSPGASHAG